MDSRKGLTVRGLLLFSLVCFLLVTSVLASHFRGGIISWRAVDPDNFDGNIEITHRVAWRRGTAYCDANTSPTTLLSGGTLSCRSGCSGNIGSMSFYCTDYSVSEDWTSGERTYTTNIGTSVTSFEASFASCCWISQVGSGSWEVRVKGDLSVRSDTGRLNTSPVSATQPIIRLCYSQPRTISIPVQDADGDVVRCRWSSSSQGECAGVCNAFSYGTLDGNTCTMSYNGRGASNGWYAVALQIEDFATSSSTTPLSSVPLQFLVNTFYSANCNSYPPPTIVDTLGDSACVGVATGTQFTLRITAQSGSTSTTITTIQTVSPLGFTKSALTRISGTQRWYIDVTWTPSSTQTGPQIFCYQAFDNVYQSSNQICITLLSGVSGPSVVPKSDEVSGEKNGQHEWSVKFNEHFTRPTSSASIKIYEQGTNELVESLDASTDPNVVFPTSGGNTTLKFYTTTHDPNVNYYVLLDPGVVNGIQHCGVQSEPIDDPQTWEAKLTCRDDYVYRYTDYTQGTCRNKYPNNPVMAVGQNSDPKDCSCPDGTVVDERKSQWTKWLNRDHHSGQGDYETLVGFLALDDPPVCEHPVGIECRVSGTQVDYRDTGEVYSCTPDVGGVCLHGNQSVGVQCSDYEVRFLCPCGSLPYMHVEYDEDYPCDCFDPADCPSCRGGAWGDPHYTSYDGLKFDLFDHCTHIFTKDCQDNTFAVYSVTSNTCTNGRIPTCIDEVYVEIGSSVLIHLYDYPPTYDFTGTSDLSSVSTTVTLQNNQITVYIRDLDVVVTFGRWLLNVQVSSDYGGKLCGLLGDCNGDKYNDMYVHNTTGHLVPATLQEFEEEHRVYNFTNDGCQFVDHMPVTCGRDDINDVDEALCDLLTDTTGNYSACHAHISPESFHSDCFIDACFVLDKQEGLCRNLLSYADQCRSLGIDVGPPPADCVPSCPVGQSFKCGPVVSSTCQHPQGTTDRDFCVMGCYCNDGKVLEVNGECVDPADCIVCPFDHVIRFGLDPQSSCRNPKPENQTKVHGCFCPEESVLNDRTGRCVQASSCPACSGSASGDPHYISYDGYRYDLFDHCTHVFSKDCANNTFAVYSITSDTCSGGRAPTCIDQAVVEVPAHRVWIYLDYLEYTFTGVGGLEDVNIEVIVGRQITVRLIDYDVVITFSRYFLSVRAPLSYRGKLCGLLGDCDGDMSNDFKLQNGSISDLMTFEEEYRAPHVNSSCSFQSPVPLTPCDAATLSQAQTFCNSLINPTGSYSNCHDVISPMNSYDSCVLDYCFVNADDSLTTVCRVIQDYADECRAHGISVGLLPVVCRPTCPPGQSFGCGPSIPQSCQNPDGYDDGYCVEGCYCNNPTILDITGECVDPSQCTECQFDHVIRFGLYPQPSCRNPNPKNQTKILGCFCPEGSVLNDRTGRCVKKPLCPACSGSASGDPHYISYDGYRYDLFDHCTHVFSKDCANNTFAVYSITSDTCSRGRAPTCIDQAVVEVPAHGVWIYLDYPLQYIYTGVGGLEDVNIEVIVGRQITVRLIDYDVVITFSRYFLSVRAPLSYRGKLCGLLGDCDGDMLNDFKLQNGSVSDLMTFEEEYRAPHVNSSCSYRDPMDASCDPATLSEAQTFCHSLIDPTGSYSNCHDVISPTDSFDSCVLDYCFVNADDHLTTVCRVIQDYADECRFHQIAVGSLPVICRPTCPPGQSFRCGPSIPQSCQNPDGYDDGYCVEGCYCNNGTILDITGECVNPSQCTVCPSDRIVRYGYVPELTCRNPVPPDGEERVIGCFCPLGYLVNDLTGKCIEATKCPACTGLASGDPHYLTYDGLYYDLFDHCSHLFSGDCVNKTFAVYSITSNRCSRGGAPTCIDRAVVEVPPLGVTIHLYMEGVPKYDFDGAPSLPANIVVVQTSSRVMLHLVDYEVYIWYGRYYLKVQAPKNYIGKLCGLLGDCNGYPSDDWKLKGGNITSDVNTLEHEYRYTNYSDLCDKGFMDPMPATCDPDDDARTLCSQVVMKNGTYSPCHDYIDPQPVYDNCLLDYCFLGEEELIDGPCRTILDYADSCRQSGVQVGPIHEMCRPQCPDGQSYRCGPLRPPSCENPQAIEDHACIEGCYCDEGTILDVDGSCVAPEDCTVCVDEHIVRFGSLPQPTCRQNNPLLTPHTRGCFCPKDMVLNDRTGRCIHPTQCSHCVGTASGDPHYLSHDGLYFDLFDHCTHLFTGDCEDETFSVYSITSNACSHGRSPTCVDGAVVDVPALGLRVVLDRSGPTSISTNDTIFDPSGVQISRIGSRIMLKITNYDVVVTFGPFYLSVAVPLAYCGKLCGLVGNGNGDAGDDWLSRNGTIFTDIYELEREYRVDLEGFSCTHQVPVMDTRCEGSRMQEAEEWCSVLRNPEGRYALCHPYISPNESYDNCVLDYCYSDPGDYEMACLSLKNYADDCRANNLQVTGLSPEECRPNCLWDTEFTCGPVYPSTCADPEGEVMTPFCVEGCFCKPGFLLDVRGDCVEPAGCDIADCRYSNYTVDLVFAIDTSESYGQRQFFYDVLDWVAHIVHRMEFGDDGVRVGIVIFGSDILVDKNIKLDEYIRNKDGLVAAIKSILWKSHGTEIGAAINYVTERFGADGEFGARNGSTKVAVFITDGNSHDNVTAAIPNARRQGVILHAVGAGESLNLDVLNQIADRPEYVYFNPWNHRDLDVIFTNASQALICDVPYPVTCDPPCNEVGGYCRHHQFCLCNEEWTGDRCHTPVCKPDCQNEGTCASPGVCNCTGNWIGDRCEDGPYLTPATDVNIMIIIDTSEDFINSFDDVVRFLLEFIEALFIGEDRTRVGVMLMGDTPIPAVMLNITNRGELTDAIDQIEFVDQQNSNPAGALGDLPTAFTSEGDYGAEETDINMAFLFTDGDNTNNPATIQAAMAVGEANITMFVVGVGGENQTTEENRAGLEAIARATGGHSVLYVYPQVPGSFSALTANLTATVFNPILTNSCLPGQSYSCGVKTNVSCGIAVWNKSRDAYGCVERCFCDGGRVMMTSDGSGACHTVDEIYRFCPTTNTISDKLPPTGVLIAIAIAALLSFAICVLCPVILCLLWLLQRRRKKSLRNRRLIVDPAAWNLGRGRADWEDEEKLIKMKDEENELVDTAFQGIGDDIVLVNDRVVDDGVGEDNMKRSSDDVKGLGIDNPMFMENDPTEDDDDKEIEEGEKDEEDKEEDGEEEQGQEEENEGQEEGEGGQEEGEEGQEEGEEAKLIDFDEEDKIDGKEPKKDPPDSTKMSLADRIKLFHVGEIQKEEQVQRPPPKSLVGKIKLFEAIQKATDPVPVKKREWPPPATTELSVPPPPPANPPPTGPPQEDATQMSQEALEKELEDIFANIN